MKAVRQIATAVMTSSVALAMVACGPDAAPEGTGRPDAPTTSTAVDPSAAPPTRSPSGSQETPRPSSQPTRSSTQEDAMRIQITIGDQQFQATLDDSAAARDLAAQLPLTVEMSDHGGVEKTGRLPSPLSLDGQPAGADPDVGDVGYYAPGNDLVLYYGDQSYYNGIVMLGRMHDDAAERIASMDGSIRVSLRS